MKKFSTTDINLASVCQTVGQKFLGLDKSNPDRIKFLFEATDDFESLLALHYQNELKISSLALLHNFRTFKNLIHQN